MSAGAKPSAVIIAAKRKNFKKKQVIDTLLKDFYQIAMDSKAKVKGPTGLVTEPRMAEHRCLWDENYPECPERLIEVLQRCRELNLIEQCKQYAPRTATKEELLTLHSASVYETLEATHENNDIEYLEEVSSKYDAIYIHPSTHELALLAAGSTIDMVDRIVSGEVQNGAALVRPPGHHAMRAEPCGYCFYNNVALAAKHAIDNRGLTRILIVDWDVHHGQATQQMFYEDDRVVYFSIHRYEHGKFWPSLRQSDFNYYQPQLVIISAGFDSAVGDEKGEMQVTPACYATLLHLLMSVCPALCVVLEGGYCLPSLAEGAALTLRTLLGHPPPMLIQTGEPSDSIRESILNCIYVQKPYWRCFKYQPTYNVGNVLEISDEVKQKHIVLHKWEGDETRPDKFATRDCYPMQDNETKRKNEDRLNHLRIVTDLSLPQHAVCYIYDEAMLKHKNITKLCSNIKIFASHHEILAVHTQNHLDRLKELASTKLRYLNSQKDDYNSVYFHPDTLESAAVAAGCVLQTVDAVLSKVAGAGVCVVRPPGHHADADVSASRKYYPIFNLAHVECPERIMRIHERLRDFGLLQRLHPLTARPATDHEILAVHTQKHLDRLKELASTKLRYLNSQKDDYNSVYFHPDTLESAAVAAGCVLQTVDAVLSKVAGAGVCVVRPPGHHADADILYISIHRYDNGTFFPHSKDADYGAVGEGAGEGYNVNIPWNKRGMGNAEYMAAFTQVVLPIAYEYNPELVIVSAGFDACINDPLGGCKVLPECYGRMTQMLKGLAGGKIILCLEGGYNIVSTSYAMTMCTKALLGDPIEFNYNPEEEIHWSAVETINNVIKTQKKYWKSLKFQLALPIKNVLDKPSPSRGLIVSTPVPQKSLSSNVTSKSSNGLQSLESDMMNLTINKCADGIHCGTDDEDDNGTDTNAGCSKSSGEGSSKTVSDKGNKESEKQTLVDYLSENMQALVDGEMFAVVPVPWCPHLDTLFAIPESVKFEQGVKCVDCEEKNENWVCLHCYITACGRSINGHMQAHHRATQHPLVLSLLDLSVWCNICDAYVDNPLLYDAKNNAHKCKFGEDMPWCYKTDIHMA
ncbi:Histone deacetylase 6 [Papilio machaon]|uniref:Histone deacetylase 6 n=1 Tax=Papilio machaon TaxID=76193 RepID=A0A0N1IFV9_PAPMA|nr:Histone deacetylase 6 [Papilio machaon]